MSATQTNIFGGSFIGNHLTALCFGVLTIQTSSYYHAFPNDGRWVKLVVGFLWILEAFQLACVTQSLYSSFVTNYDNPLAHVAWNFTAFQISAVCASVTVQTFFAHRVYSLSSNLYLGVFVQVLVLVQFGFGAATSVASNIVPSYEILVKDWTWLVVSWMAMQAIADVVIAACMCLLLRRRRTGFQKTDSVINHMVLYTVSTGLVTSILSCILLGMFAKHGFDFSVFALCMPLAAFYSITVLAKYVPIICLIMLHNSILFWPCSLHTRKRLQATLDAPIPLKITSSSIKNRMAWNRGDHGDNLSVFLGQETPGYKDKYRQRGGE
ncbi:hypothetical protein BS47DRAFT_1345873 [Hydnum rufescens UP504]|uniref:DUF6534 domain-containing protein n=1 Tax=Hydnum rufescens UP504 TaxID=1448309 RepID=A0A9P6AUB2_9AGAM|nr:hypothetical protein BS47DRAFT_1345873 [Hydnum rufescens UP504]